MIAMMQPVRKCGDVRFIGLRTADIGPFITRGAGKADHGLAFCSCSTALPSCAEDWTALPPSSDQPRRHNSATDVPTHGLVTPAWPSPGDERSRQRSCPVANSGAVGTSSPTAAASRSWLFPRKPRTPSSSPPWPRRLAWQPLPWRSGTCETADHPRSGQRTPPRNHRADVSSPRASR